MSTRPPSAYEQADRLRHNAQANHQDAQLEIGRKQHVRNGLLGLLKPRREARAAAVSQASGARDALVRCDDARQRIGEPVARAEQQVATARDLFGPGATDEQIKAHVDETARMAQEVARRKAKESQFIGARLEERTARDAAKAEAARLDDRTRRASTDLANAEAAIAAEDEKIAALEAQIADLGDIEAEAAEALRVLKAARERADRIASGDFSEAFQD